jgi:hypothetical protein
MTAPTVSRQIPHMTPAGQPTSESDPPPEPGPSSPNEPGGIFAANLKGAELANLCRDTITDHRRYRQVIGRVRRESTLSCSVLRHCGLE